MALGLLAIGPWVMSHVFGQDYDYGRVGLALLGIGMGFHLMAGTFNQAKLARGQATACGGLLGVRRRRLRRVDAAADRRR